MNSYLGFKILRSYGVEECADFCNKTPLCKGFNVYVERDPSINPGDCSCPNPPSFANFKCSVWGSSVEAVDAVNYGQTRNEFQVVIVASNGYEKASHPNHPEPPTPPGWKDPEDCYGGTFNETATLLDFAFFPGPFDVNVCAIVADAYNKGSHSRKCTFFNAFVLSLNGTPLGTYCNLFSKEYPASLATYKPANYGGSWSAGESWSYSLA